VVGASGLVGSTLCERWLDRHSHEVVPFIHSSGNAWRLARRGIPLKVVDLMSREQTHAALDGCTHVVNCTRGGEDFMLQGLNHLLEAARKASVRGFVHLSSVVVYGDPPTKEAASEDGPTPAHPKGTYGWVKLEQDWMVRKEAQRGLPSVILCPPNVSGPYSYFLLAVLQALRDGQLVLVDEGRTPCNLVDVHNLAYAIELALEHANSSAPRLFVTDAEPTEWSDVTRELFPLVEGAGAVPSITREEAMAITAAKGAKSSLLHSLKHLGSSDVRAALRKDPLWERLERSARTLVTRLGRETQDRIRLAVDGPLRSVSRPYEHRHDLRLLSQQARRVRHSCARAEAMLGYRPLYSFSQSMQAFRTWYRSEHRIETPFWELLRRLSQ
jgi:nucleoside-diphosphate-sugar epimerase